MKERSNDRNIKRKRKPNMEKMKCLFCNAEIDNSEQHEDYASWIDCPICGKYAFSRWETREITTYPKDIVATYMYHENKVKESERPEEYTMFIGSQRHYDELKAKHPNYHYVTKEEMIAFYPRKL